jgi:transcriptional regulator with XRE-family HTH domain
MKFSERLRRLRDSLGLTNSQIAEIFGVDDIQTVRRWAAGESNLAPEFRATLLRLEADNLPALSPKLRPETVAAFYAGRKRMRAA